jgi:RNA polymerase sigma-70 factor (ECF subfamily)
MRVDQCALDRSAIAGRDADFRVLYDAHLGLVQRLLERLGVRHADLNDMVQKVFLITFMKLPEFEGRSSLATWLYAVCRRVAAAYRRSCVVRREICTDPVTFAELSRDLDTVASDVVLAQQAELERLLSKLTKGQRAAFVLSEAAELAGAEVAAALNIPVGTARSRLRRAREKFRRVRRSATRQASDHAN